MSIPIQEIKYTFYFYTIRLIKITIAASGVLIEEF